MAEFCWLEQDLNKQIAEEQEAVTAARIRAAKLLQALVTDKVCAPIPLIEGIG
jgi:hypothetical protein